LFKGFNFLSLQRSTCFCVDGSVMKIDKKRVPHILLLLLMLSVCVQERAIAQFGIGAGLDIRSEEPANGYGIRLEYKFFELPVAADLRVRLHGSYFFEEKIIRFENRGIQSEVREGSSAFDVGAAVLAGVNVGMVSPYAGAGIGVDGIDNNPRQGVTQYSRIKEENMFWTALFGAEIKFIPYIKPFFEYRFVQLLNTGDIDFTESERLSIGVIMRF